MNDYSRKPQQISGARHVWLLPAIIAGALIGVVLRFIAPELMTATAIVGRIFMAALFVIIVPLVAGQFALALNNPRERVRRGVPHAKILVTISGIAVVLIVLSLVLATVFGSTEIGSSFSSTLKQFNPEQFVSFGFGGGIYIVLALSLVLSALLGAMGDRAQYLVTICNRVTKASIRTFRLVLLATPIGLLSVVGAFALSSDPSTVSPTIPLAVSILIAAAGLMLYGSIVLGVDLIMGQLRPARKETRGYDRDRRPTRRTGPGSHSAPAGRPVTRDRSPQRTSPETRRERERSPFDMGVSSTPVLDIPTPSAPKSESKGVPPTSGNRRDDARPKFTREGQADAPREGQREGQRDGQREGQREGYRDRGPRNENRDSSRDGYRDRGPRGSRNDRQGADRRSSGFRPDHRVSAHQQESAEPTEQNVQTPKPIDAASVSADLARVREQLKPSPPEIKQPLPHVETRPESIRPEPVEVRPEPVREASAPITPTNSPSESTEVHYGRSRNPKYARREPEKQLPGIEPPPMPDMIDHYETDDMAFGRSKRRKTAK